MRYRISQTLLLTGSLLMAGLATPAAAQQTATPEQERIAKGIVLRGILLPGVTDPLMASDVSSPKPEIMLVVQNDGKTAARARVGFVMGNFLSDVTVTGPISGGTLVNNNGPATGTSIRVRGQYVSWTVGAKDAKATRSLAARNNSDLVKLSNGRLVAKELTTATDVSTRSAMRSAERSADATLRSSVPGAPAAFFVSGAYEFGSQEFDFIDPTSLVDSSVTKDSSTGNFSAGVLLAGNDKRSAENPGIYFGGGVDVYRRFKATDERDICRPIGTGGFECDKFRVGAPTEKTGQSLEFESRLWVASATIGLNPKVNYDLKDKIWNVELPVYFLKVVADVDKPLFSGIPDLAGGVSVGWKSGDSRGTYVLFFIGPTFKLPSMK